MFPSPSMKADKNVALSFFTAFIQVRDCVGNIIDILDV